MGNVLSPAEVTKRFVDKMGGTVGESYSILYNHTVWLFSKWSDYQFLFDSAPRIEVLNSTAGAFFHDLQIWLHESILLHIRRLADPPQSAGRHTLSLKGFRRLLQQRNTDLALLNAFDAALEDVDIKTEFAKEWRNKRIAHTPLPSFAGGSIVALPVAGIAEIDAGVNSIGNAMNIVHRHFIGHDTSWISLFDVSVGTAGLMYYLKKGLEAKRGQP